MGFLMTGGIMIATIAYLWKRRRKTEGGKTAVLLFALVFLYPIIAGGSLEKIWLGYLATLLLSAPIPSRMFVNYAHQMPAGQRHEFYYIPNSEQVCPSLQRHGIPSRCALHYSDTVFRRASRCALHYSDTVFRRVSRCALHYSDTVFPRASGCVFCYSRFAAGVFLAVSLVMEPSCSALMAASPPGPADARIGLIGTASQQPAERSPDRSGRVSSGRVSGTSANAVTAPLLHRPQWRSSGLPPGRHEPAAPG